MGHTPVSLMSHSRLPCVSFMSHLSRTHFLKYVPARPHTLPHTHSTSITFVSHMCLIYVSFVSHSCLIRVLFVSYSCLIRVLFVSYSSLICLVHPSSNKPQHDRTHDHTHPTWITIVSHLCLIYVLFMSYSCRLYVAHALTHAPLACPICAPQRSPSSWI
ncbi:hypothetical protein CLV59_101974 [Chitinophaga dinghuensis]|uniref:Uncharacterized protein n=1 Tax=Chitinophaga dinghuensis TaxID=1539050 RepID=A0A327WBS2_9BACT|nr:hypothetical protein CLV59_101974 [Chitinophaga dinghuensis]